MLTKSKVGVETVSSTTNLRSDTKSEQFLVLAFAGVLLLASIAIAAGSRGYLDAVRTNGDNLVYAAVASDILSGTPVGFIKQFWGFPYAVVALSRLLPIGILQVMAVISIASTLGAVWLSSAMWGPWVAAYFIAGSYMLIQFGAFAGADPLFAFLFLWTLYLVREEKWTWAALAISLATTVRPLGIFCLAALLLQLLRLRKPKLLLAASIISAVILGVYFASIAHFTGGALKGVTSYRTGDWAGGLPLTAPLWGIITNAINGIHVGGTGMKVVKVGYVLLHIAALIFLFSSPKRRASLLAAAPVDFIALSLYSAFILCYNAPEWALSIYPRLLIPISPILLATFGYALPRRWAVIAAIGLCSVALAVLSNLGPARVMSLF